MKNLKKIIFLLVLVNVTFWIKSPKTSAQISVGFQVFYDDLSPYGTWVNNPSYGYVWIPNVDQGFSPYRTNGHWVFTNAGWTWYSDYSWGWAPFHYGRWYTDANYGPMWVPGNEWGPGWVTWRQSEGYYGWAPIEPGISISVAYSNGYNVPNDRWVFLRGRDFGRANYNNYYINNSKNTTIIKNSTIINNFSKGGSGNVGYHSGPVRRDVEKHIGRAVTPYTIKESNKQVQRLNKNQLEIYRPQVKNADGAGHKQMPKKVVELKEVKSLKDRTTTSPHHNGNHAPVMQQHNNQTDKHQPGIQQNEKHAPAKQQHRNQTDKHQPLNTPDKEQKINKQPMDRQPIHQEAAPDHQNNQQGRNQKQPSIRESRDGDVKPLPGEQLHNRKQGESMQQHDNRENIQKKSNKQPSSPNERKDDQNRPH